MTVPENSTWHMTSAERQRREANTRAAQINADPNNALQGMYDSQDVREQAGTASFHPDQIATFLEDNPMVATFEWGELVEQALEFERRHPNATQNESEAHVKIWVWTTGRKLWVTRHRELGARDDDDFDKGIHVPVKRQTAHKWEPNDMIKRLFEDKVSLESEIERLKGDMSAEYSQTWEASQNEDGELPNGTQETEVGPELAQGGAE